MTTNERLAEARLLDAFDAAARARDRKTMIKILMKVQFDAAGSAHIADMILANPGRYGFVQ